MEIKVKIDCDGCERKIERVVSSMSGKTKSQTTIIYTAIIFKAMIIYRAIIYREIIYAAIIFTE